MVTKKIDFVKFKDEILPKAKIGVLMGGFSSEREISLKSAKSVIDSLRQINLQVIPIDITKDDIELNKELIRSSGIDCAFIALHGRFGEDGQIQELLDVLKIPYTCSGVRASRLAMDKVSSHQIFITEGLNVPKYTVVLKSSFEKKQVLTPPFNLPWVVKPVTQGSSIGLSIIDHADNFDAALKEAFAFDDKVMVEEYIKGKELTVGILDEQPLAVIEIITKNKFFDYQAKYQSGMTEYIVPAKIDNDLTRQAQQAALTAHKSLGCYGCSRVDILLTEDRKIYILELNNIPGLTQTSLLPKAAKSCGIDFTQLCLTLLRLAYEKR